jgi:hypothetical protein
MRTWRQDYTDDPFGFWPKLFEHFRTDTRNINKWDKKRVKP